MPKVVKVGNKKSVVLNGFTGVGVGVAKGDVKDMCAGRKSVCGDGSGYHVCDTCTTASYSDER